MHKISSLWLESLFIHTGAAHALQESHHLLLILEDEFSRKTFFSCLKLPQKDAQLWVQLPAASENPAAEHSSSTRWSAPRNRADGNCCQHHREPSPRLLGMLRAGTASGTSGMLATEERVPKQPTNSDCGHGDNAGTQMCTQNVTELPQQHS